MRACSLLRHGDHYRAEQFCEGLRRHGYQVERKWQRQPRPSDLLIVWNRTRGYDPIAERYEQAGARVLVAENGYLDRIDGRKFYSLALGSHNGAGQWFVGGEPRFEIADQPWREAGSKVLVLPQRGIGQKGVAMPSSWAMRIVQRLRQITDREIVLRKHPGHIKGAPPPDFRDVWCAVTWGSGAGVKALQAGIPVFHEFPLWIGAPAAAPLAGNLENCQTPSRRLLWTRISWAQWSLEEIASGEAFDRILHEDHRSLFRASPLAIPDRREGDVSGDRPRGSLGPAPLVAYPS